ncbi:MAG: ABC transporter substrate-binding protein [Proteobacteria bacterium]|nr:ABC transporter substrate-binding protein [Pseudomonadota bacterium]
MGRKVRNFILATIAILIAIAGALWATIAIVKPEPKGRIVMATGGAGGAYHELALAYQKDLARFGVELELRPKVQGTDTLKALFPQFKAEFKGFDESTADIEAGFIKGGFAGTLYGRLASEREQVWHQRQVDNLRSVGRLFYEPLWVFTRAGEPLDSLRKAKSKRIIVGTPVGGAQRIAVTLLKANGVDQSNATLIKEEFTADGDALIDGKADVAMVINPADSVKVQTLLRNPKLQLMNFAAEADAYTSRFPALSKLVLKQGSIEFDPETPSADITLLATSAVLVVRTSLNPSLQTLLASAVLRNPRSGVDRVGDPVLFHRAGEFPHVNDPEFSVPVAVSQLYKSGSLPVLLRGSAIALNSTRMPFWPAAFINEHGTQTLLLLLPLAGILLPLFHYLPILYKWMVRRRLLAWYRRLKVVEAAYDHDRSETNRVACSAEIERIDAAASRARVPLAFTDQLYDLRGHIDIVRRRLEARGVAGMASAAE